MVAFAPALSNQKDPGANRRCASSRIKPKVLEWQRNEKTLNVVEAEFQFHNRQGIVRDTGAEKQIPISMPVRSRSRKMEFAGALDQRHSKTRCRCGAEISIERKSQNVDFSRMMLVQMRTIIKIENGETNLDG
ncbi:hypothetical protein LXL04_029587 [Taraxacum kok-saghyz]